MTTYDLCVVGAGVAGLYAAYQWRKKHPSGSVVILEAGERAGGRLETARFGGVDVPLGAGIGRVDKDARLLRLLRELNVPHYPFVRQVEYGPSVAAINEEHLQRLKDAPPSQKAEAFGEFARRILGRRDAKALILSMGYTDMVHESSREVMLNYGLDDNYGGGGGFAVPWQDLTRALVKAIGPRRFIYHTPVTGIAAGRVSTPFGHLSARKVIVATTLPTLRALFPRVREYRFLSSQPFLRVYAKFPVSMRPLMAATVSTYTVVKPPLQKIIPIDAKKGVYMIAYSDNVYANRLVAYTNNTPANCNYFARLLEKTLSLPKWMLKISSIRSKFWEDGTHFVKPEGGGAMKAGFFEGCRYPRGDGGDVMVVGEAVAEHHRGWVEGALESVDAGLEFIASK